MRNKIFGTLLKIVISFSLIFYLLYKINNEIGFEKLTGIFTGIDIYWLIFAVVLVTVSNLLGAFQWRFLLRSREIDISYGRTLSYYYTGLFFNNFLLSLFGGDISRIYDISKHSGKSSTAISSVFLDRLIGLTAMAILAVIFGIIASNLFNNGYFLLLTGGFFLFFLFIFLFFYFKNFAKKFQAVTEKVLPAVVFQKLREVYNSINYFKNHRNLILCLLFNSLIVQSLRIGAHYVAALALNINDVVSVSIWYFYIFVPIIFVITLLPISIGGLGVREGIGVVLFGYVGISKGMAFSIEFLAYIIGIIASVPGGLAFVLKKHEKPDEESSIT